MNNLYSGQPSVPLSTAEKIHSGAELTRAVNRSHEILFSASTAFPFTLFPDTVTVDREKLTLTKRLFFRVAESMSIRIEDILNVTADVGPFFGSVKISTRFFDPHKPYTVNYFWRQDAIRLKRIIQGYIIAIQEKIDCSALSAKELANMLNNLGHGGLSGEI
jgi:hypothetical protein